MANCPECQVPDGGVILNRLHVLEYLDPADGAIYKMDLSCDGSGEDLAPGKYFELAQWANFMAAAPILADMVGQYLFDDEDDGGGDEISEVTA